jgi:hypothetical protein
MNSTKRPNYESFESFNATRSDCGESDFNMVIELDESEMGQVAGGYSRDKSIPILIYHGG